MKYGGHQTFAIRDGWLYKGLLFLHDSTKRDYLSDDDAFDQLGVGKNMAKSIRHWLLATALAKKNTEKSKNGKIVGTKELHPTDFAKLIKEYDENFLDENTWWFIHINLVHNSNYAASWHWFFNKFHLNRFTKSTCLQSLIREETLAPGNTPSSHTLDRDLSCFLSSYSKEVPTRKNDPEDEIECPLTELGLIKHFRSSGHYQIQKSRKHISFHVFYYALMKCLSDRADWSLSNNRYEISFYDLLGLKNGPGKVFSLSNENLFELILLYEKTTENKELQFYGLAGDRILSVIPQKPIDTIQQYFEEVSQ